MQIILVFQQQEYEWVLKEEVHNILKDLHGILTVSLLLLRYFALFVLTSCFHTQKSGPRLTSSYYHTQRFEFTKVFIYNNFLSMLYTQKSGPRLTSSYYHTQDSSFRRFSFNNFLSMLYMSQKNDVV